jgi:CheY-like chemotaxis protein
MTMLEGRRVLLVEDEYFIVDDMMHLFRSKGAEIVGPAASVGDALGLIEAAGHIDGAVLDVNLQGKMVYPVADALLARGVPFVFATCYDLGAIPARYEHIARCEKPVAPFAVARALFA